MKKATMLFIILIIASQTRGQDAPNFNEWFNQKKTQIKYLVQQIAALQVYLGYLKKGYEIVDQGLTTIGNIKDGAFNQDKDYLNSLKAVNPVVSDSPQVNAVLAYHHSIIGIFQNLQEFVKDNEYFTLQEKDYVRMVNANMLKECSDSIDELTLILTADYAEMKDDDRLLRIDKVHEEMLDKYGFTKNFASSTKLLAMQRAKEDVENRDTGRFFN